MSRGTREKKRRMNTIFIKERNETETRRTQVKALFKTYTLPWGRRYVPHSTARTIGGRLDKVIRSACSIYRLLLDLARDHPYIATVPFYQYDHCTC